ncbi:MAG: hypothetical protein EBU20_00345 [Betaproteobacteria bacterium]|nr:hypothetical protein [Betaproteobacteria bacterium]
MTIYWVIAYFLVLALTLIYKTPILRGPWLFLLRSFFPNWKFFHAVGYVPHLYARAATTNAMGEHTWTDWTHLYPRTSQSIWHLFHNPQTNLGLAQQNLIMRFEHPEHTHTQFELRMLMDNTTDTIHSHVMMTSPVEART